ncbi:MAG: DNA replication/repair protein RecF [Candidatus Nanopelagicales bacterium]|nr:DNA replication/repair protein RecF [Candidatus Nanopelagicales bacterium]
MRIAHLGLTDFRNYPSLEVDFSPGVNILLGSNGQGKTNAVEAVAYLATFGSHRVANDTALVRAGCDSAVIRSTVTHGDRTIGLDVQINPGRSNRLQVNRSPVRRTRDALGIVRAVMFAPEDLSLVKGEPGARRRFLDQLLVQSSPKFAGVIADYDKVLRQRNSLLRSAAKSSSGLERDTLHSTLAVWDERLVTFGSQIMAGRVGVLADIREPAAAAYAEVAQTRNRLELRYVPSRLSNGPQTEQDFAQELTRCLGEIRKEEFARAVTLVGPHRDELEIGLNDLPARGYASHGESWSVALALRLASFEMLQTDQSGEPILILDDVFAELDSVRRERLAQIASRSPGQVLITAAVSDDVPEQLSGVRFLVDNATIGELR